MTIKANRASVDSVLAAAKSIYVSGFGAEIEMAPTMFKRAGIRRATVTGLFSPLVNHQCYADAESELRVRTFFLTRSLKQNLASGFVEYCPWRYGMIDRWLGAPGRFDTALVMLSPPDSRGRCSLGVQADFLPGFLHQVEHVVGFVNPQMPFTLGDTLVDYHSLAAIEDYDRPLVTLAERPSDEAVAAIAQAIINLIPDDASVQFGVGQIPSQVLGGLGGHRGLRIHSGVIDDNILKLEASGALDRDTPIVTGTAVGGKHLYEALADRRFSFRRVGFTHSYRAISDIKRFVAVNSVLKVDLLGQVSAEGSGGKLVASPGGLPDFVRGALESDGGASIVAVRAQGVGGHASGIVPLLEPSSLATTSAVDVDIIVTEFGAARVRGLSIDERAEAIIAISGPQAQEQLMREWTRIRRELFTRVGASARG